MSLMQAAEMLLGFSLPGLVVPVSLAGGLKRVSRTGI